MLEKYVDIIKSLLPKEERTRSNIRKCVDELEELKTDDKLMNEFTDNFISLCKFLDGEKLEILNVPKEIRTWFMSEFNIEQI